MARGFEQLSDEEALKGTIAEGSTPYTELSDEEALRGTIAEKHKAYNELSVEEALQGTTLATPGMFDEVLAHEHPEHAFPTYTDLEKMRRERERNEQLLQEELAVEAAQKHTEDGTEHEQDIREAA